MLKEIVRTGPAINVNSKNNNDDNSHGNNNINININNSNNIINNDKIKLKGKKGRKN